MSTALSNLCSAGVDFLLVPVGLGHEIDPDSVVGRLGFFECQSDPVWERRILFVVSRCRDASRQELTIAA